MRIAMLDPSAFTIPYDAHLCQALAKGNSQVAFFTRPIRKQDYYAEHFDFATEGGGNCQTLQHFYRLTERLPWAQKFRLLRSVIKGGEHLMNMAKLKQKLIALRTEAIHFQWLPIPIVDHLFLPQLKLLAPLILTVHDANAFLAPSSRLQTYRWQAALHEFDALIVHTQAGMHSLVERGLSRSKIHIVPHGLLNAADSHQKKSDGNSLSASKSSKFTFLAFGSIKPYKGLDILISALSEVPSSLRSELKLVIAGNPGSLGNDLQRMAFDYGVENNIEWHLRFIKDEEVPALFHQADAVVFPYREIDASGALMTALPYGKAVIASRLGLFSELLKDGETAYLVEPNDSSALAEAMIRAATNPSTAKEMGARAEEVASHVCSWERIAERTLEIYQDLQRKEKI